MAGYMRKLNGHVYNGEFIAGEALENGLFGEITSTGVKKTSAAKDTIMRVVEKTTLWGMEAVVQDVVSTGADEVFFIENEWDIDDSKDYDTANYTLAAGKYVKMHRPLVGEQLIATVGNTLYTALAVGDQVQPVAAGTVAKYTA